MSIEETLQLILANQESIKNDMIEMKSVKKDVETIKEDMEKQKTKTEELSAQVKKLQNKVDNPVTNFSNVLKTQQIQNKMEQNDSRKEITTSNNVYTMNAKVNKLFESARKIIGLSPITEDTISWFMENEDLPKEEAEKAAVREYLQLNLQYSNESISCANIIRTRQSSKKELETVYVTFDSEQAVQGIYRRSSIVKNSSVKLTQYIPPQLYTRYIKLEEYCAKMREKEENIRTRVKLGENDFMIQIKKAGTKYWKTTEVPRELLLPEVDFTVEWNHARNEVPTKSTSPPKYIRRTLKRKERPSTSPSPPTVMYILEYILDN